MAKHVGIMAYSPPGAALCFEILSAGASSLVSEFGASHRSERAFAHIKRLHGRD
jgi:hypothetical protein